jgi:hypothetical protein
MNHNVQHKIDEALSSINALKKASPKPFLLTRVNAALNNGATENIWSQIAYYLKQPAIAVTAILLVLMVNIFVISRLRTDKRGVGNISKKAGNINDDFAINVSVMYDTENQEQ